MGEFVGEWGHFLFDLGHERLESWGAFTCTLRDDGIIVILFIYLFWGLYLHYFSLWKILLIIFIILIISLLFILFIFLIITIKITLSILFMLFMIWYTYKLWYWYIFRYLTRFQDMPISRFIIFFLIFISIYSFFILKIIFHLLYTI